MCTGVIEVLVKIELSLLNYLLICMWVYFFTKPIFFYFLKLILFISIVEGPESSDSGVDANSVSSCDLSIVQPGMQTNVFNQQQCVEYLRNGE